MLPLYMGLVCLAVISTLVLRWKRKMGSSPRDLLRNLLHRRQTRIHQLSSFAKLHRANHLGQTARTRKSASPRIIVVVYDLLFALAILGVMAAGFYFGATLENHVIHHRPVMLRGGR